MLLQALKTDDPEEQLKIYEKVVEKDPTNTEARNGYREARTAVEKKKAAEAEDARQRRSLMENQARGQSALRLAEEAALAGNLGVARQRLNEARSLGQAGPEVLRVDRIIGRAESVARIRRTVGFGSAGLVLAGILAWVVSLFTRRQPYIELLTGAARGRRYPVDKEVLTIGAVAQRGEESNDVVISDPEKTVSRFHCEIHRKGRRYYVVDCRSANGTLVDGRAIPPGRLWSIGRGSRIQLGTSCTLKFGFERRKS